MILVSDTNSCKKRKATQILQFCFIHPIYVLPSCPSPGNEIIIISEIGSNYSQQHTNLEKGSKFIYLNQIFKNQRVGPIFQPGQKQFSNFNGRCKRGQNSTLKDGTYNDGCIGALLFLRTFSLLYST